MNGKHAHANHSSSQPVRHAPVAQPAARHPTQNAPNPATGQVTNGGYQPGRAPAAPY